MCGLDGHPTGGWCLVEGVLERVPVPDPGALGVVEAVCQPLLLEELEAVFWQVERLAASENNI